MVQSAFPISHAFLLTALNIYSKSESSSPRKEKVGNLQFFWGGGGQNFVMNTDFHSSKLTLNS
jgi:hypothetical protein